MFFLRERLSNNPYETHCLMYDVILIFCKCVFFKSAIFFPLLEKNNNKNETFATSGNRERQTLQHTRAQMRRTCPTADTRRWIPWQAFKTLVSEHINTTERCRTINTGAHARIHAHVCTHDCHHITPNHNPRAWTSNEASF